MDFLQSILDGLGWFASQLYTILGWLLDGLLYTIKGFFWLFFSGVLTTFYGAIKGISYSSVVFQWAAAKSSMPPMAGYVAVAIGFPEFVTIIAAAYAVRLALNLIPSWATRA